ncbi:MAG TPA: laccase domain-containing protein, partial [Nevskiaceae bacterium]|nr:laccase domain-containing protein [Nevskiaceae bacterium]
MTLQPDWPAPQNVRAAFTLRTADADAAIYARYRTAPGSPQAAKVSANRRRLIRDLKLPSDPAWLQQVHGTRVLRAPWSGEEPQADASYTTQRGVVCVVQS